MFNLKRAGGKKESSYSSKSQCPHSTRQTDYISLHRVLVAVLGIQAYRDLHACSILLKDFVIGLFPHSLSGTMAAVYEINNIRRCKLGSTSKDC